ncbi:VCBS domain-containing protein, partial [Achromobacter ruhlandii]|uniref:VCBS domain-containing protein n=1 Tax=Achromobacter ruhlandii TaxID=72557 RepID=UPI003D2567EB
MVCRGRCAVGTGGAVCEALQAGEGVADTIAVAVDEGHGGTAPKTITVTITGTNDAAVITPSKPGDDA